MDSITVENFRCFGEKQTAKLAPLTLLVGDNSTGKTSFLALIRAMWDVAYAEVVPDFREEPFDLGSYIEIVNSSALNNSAAPIEAQFEDESHSVTSFTTAFGNREGAPYPFKRRVRNKDRWMELAQDSSTGPITFNYGDAETQYNVKVSDEIDRFSHRLGSLLLAPISLELDRKSDGISGLPSPMNLDFGLLQTLRSETSRPYASAPIRSRPSRTYDPSLITRDPEGDYTPSYLANMSMRKGHDWEELIGKVTDFGRNSGLFDDIKVHHLGKTEGSPFQIHVRKRGKKRRGSFKNLVDMGYGISQVLPILTELLRPDGPQMFLLQQPEVHLHPSAQAALGTLFCSMAATGKQIIVETHSDHLMDRIRMDVRDSTTQLDSEDVSILFFERNGHSVAIHSISIDDDGNLNGVPPGYRQFFMDEVNRSIGLVRLEGLNRCV